MGPLFASGSQMTRVAPGLQMPNNVHLPPFLLGCYNAGPTTTGSRNNNQTPPPPRFPMCVRVCVVVCACARTLGDLPTHPPLLDCCHPAVLPAFRRRGRRRGRGRVTTLMYASFACRWWWSRARVCLCVCVCVCFCACMRVCEPRSENRFWAFGVFLVYIQTRTDFILN